MRPAPRLISDEQTLYTAALRALMRRAYSVFEMRAYLERRAEKPDAARPVIARLRREKLIDDARYALDFARHHANLRHQGRYRVVRELRTRGVPDRYIESAVAEVLAETDEALQVRTLIARKLRVARGPLDQRREASLYRTLLRAGFDAELVRRELRTVRGGQAASAMPDPSEEYSAEEG